MTINLTLPQVDVHVDQLHIHVEQPSKPVDLAPVVAQLKQLGLNLTSFQGTTMTKLDDLNSKLADVGANISGIAGDVDTLKAQLQEARDQIAAQGADTAAIDTALATATALADRTKSLDDSFPVVPVPPVEEPPVEVPPVDVPPAEPIV